MKVLVIGKSCIETTCIINEKFEEGKTIRVENKTECSGGLAGNIAYLLGKWGIETYIASMIGSDDGATKIKKDFEAIGIKTDYIETTFDKKTGQILSLVNESTRNKTILDLISNSYLKKYSFGIEADIIVSDGNDFNATAAAFEKYSKIPTFLVITRVDNEILELCKYGGYNIFSKAAAEKITGIKFDFSNSATLVNIYNKLKQKFAKSEIIITLKERGVIYSINGQVKIMPPVRTAIIDTNGAKDVFVGSFVYCMARNFGLEKSLAYASIAASMSTTKLTSRNSIPALIDVSNYYDAKFGAQNNPNNQNAQNTQNTPNNNTSNGEANKESNGAIDTKEQTEAMPNVN